MELEKDGKMKTTPAQLEEFQKECQRWLDYFHVNDWYVYYSILKIKGDYARTSVHYESRQAGIFLSDCGQIEMPLALIAKHEVIEAFVIGKLKDMALGGKHSEGEIEEETHRVVWLLSKVICPSTDEVR